MFNKDGLRQGRLKILFNTPQARRCDCKGTAKRLLRPSDRCGKARRWWPERIARGGQTL